MPPEGLDWLPKDTLLTDDEIIRLVRIAVSLGVTEVRLTGGEPLLRRGVPDLVARIGALRPRPEISVTTNGILLARDAGALAAAGLDRVNVSLDTLDPERFKRIAFRDKHAAVLAGLGAAQAAGLTPVKVNAVLLRGVNDDEAPELLGWALREGYLLRFIEQMPLDAQHGWDRGAMVTAQEILDRLGERFALEPEGEAVRGSAPAETWLVDGGPEAPGGGRVGVIASVTRPFCEACDRTRVTADGQVRTCLFAREESDLRSLLRSGAPDEAVADAWRTAMLGKKAAAGIGEPGFVQPERPMSAIGG